MAQPMCETEWQILRDLADGTLRWGAAVGAVWKNLAAHGYVEPNFGPITDEGREAVAEHFATPTPEKETSDG